MNYATMNAIGLSSVLRGTKKGSLRSTKSRTKIKRKMIHFLDLSWIYAKPTVLK